MSNVLKTSHREIPLTKGKVALIDADDYERLARFKWYFDGRYARTCVTWEGRQVVVYMHRAVVRAPEDVDVDHINGDRLNNRKYNLRFCTDSQNLGNSGKRKNSGNPYKGITPWGNRWRARIGAKHIGMFPTPEDAARAYDAAAIEKWGDFAWTNFPVSSAPR